MIDALRRGTLFSRLEPEQLTRISQHASRVTLEAEQVLFYQDDAATRFYLLLDGQMRLFRLAADGGEKVIEIVNPGQTFAEALVFLNAPRYPVCAAALSPAHLLAIDAADFASMLRDSVDTCFQLLGVLSQRLRGLIGEIDDLTLHTATSRVARYLVAQRTPGQMQIALAVRKSVLASRLSVQPETFSRVIKALSAQGVIQVLGNQITVCDLNRLIQIAELDDLVAPS
jgi:CRP/FNR family transcriptional regulator, dissimilatory nitrate respiration regulator